MTNKMIPKKRETQFQIYDIYIVKKNVSSKL